MSFTPLGTPVRNNSDSSLYHGSAVVAEMQRRGWKFPNFQKRHPDLYPLAYYFHDHYAPLLRGHGGYQTRYGLTNSQAVGIGKQLVDLSLWESSQAYNTALDRLRDSMGSNAQLGATIAEYRSSLSLVHNRAMRLVDAWRSLRRGRLRDFFAKLAVEPKRKHQHTKWTKPKHASALWLEYWFGWAPLVDDIYNSVEVLQGPVPYGLVKGSAKFVRKHAYTSTFANYRQRQDHLFKGRVRIRGYVRIDNPNLYLANALGLLNPATIAWELVPFSFVVDWFLPVNKFLERWTMFTGLGLRDFSTVVSVSGKGEMLYANYDPSNSQECLRSVSTFNLRRQAYGKFGAPLGYTFVPLKTKRVSTTRAATSISLLIQLFLKG